MTDKPTKDKPIVALSSRIAYETPWIKIQQDETLRAGNQKGIYDFVDTDDSVVICALNEQKELYIIYTYSYPTNSWSWQLPGGGSDGEPALEAAKRELYEETGTTASSYQTLGNLIVCSGLLKERMGVVVATDLTIGKQPEEADDIDVITEGKFVSLSEIHDMIQKEEICDSQSISALYLLERWMEENHGN